MPWLIWDGMPQMPNLLFYLANTFHTIIKQSVCYNTPIFGEKSPNICPLPLFTFCPLLTNSRIDISIIVMKISLDYVISTSQNS